MKFLNVGQSAGPGTVHVSDQALLGTQVRTEVISGASGAASVVVDSGAHWETAILIVSAQVGAPAGTVTVTGTDTILSASGVVTIGKVGTGELRVAEAAHVTADSVALGAEATSTNNMLSVVEDGTLSLTGSGGIRVAVAQGSSATVAVTLDGAIDASGKRVDVGLGGTGSVAISAGGKLKTENGYFGYDGGDGTVEISGEDSTWENGSLYLGRAGPGTLNILDGATVSSTGIGESYVGWNGGASTVLIDGEGSVWNLSSRLEVAFHNHADLTIRNQGRITSESGDIGHLGYGANVIMDNGS